MTRHPSAPPPIEPPAPNAEPASRSTQAAPRGIPSLVRLALRFLLPAADREFFMGDLEESGRRRWSRELAGALALRLTRAPAPHRHPPQKGDGMIQQLLTDLRFGFRMMRRNPGFTFVALLTMALGIGANTAMFSIVHGVVLKPFPYPDADRIVVLRENNLSRGFTSFSIAPDNFVDWKARNRTMERIAAYMDVSVAFTGGDRPENLRALRVSEDYLEILGGEPVRGRRLTGQDFDLAGEPAVVLTYGFWQRAFGGDPGAVGRTMVLDGEIHTIAGVLPQHWRPLSRLGTDLILPLRPEPFWSRYAHFLVALGRLKPGVTLEQARAEFAAIAAALESEYADSNKGWGTVIWPLEEVAVGSTRPQLLMFMAMVGLVLLIACANLANMTLARGAARARELAIRAAVGAGRRRVVRQLLVESLLLSTVAGALGLALAFVMLDAFVGAWPTLLPRMHEIGVNTTVLIFALGLSIGSGVLFGLAPAVSVTGPDLRGILSHGNRTHAGSRPRRWARAGLVVGELGLAASLLVGTGLLVRSLSALQAENAGFRTEDRLVFSATLPRAKYPTPESLRVFGDAAIDRLASLPGVKSAAVTSLIPIDGRDERTTFYPADRQAGDAQDGPVALIYRVSPGYFATMGIPVQAGRAFTAADRDDGPPVMVVSASAARQYFQGLNPIGRTVRFGTSPDSPTTEIVGVVGDVQHDRLGEESMPQIYVPFAQRPDDTASFVLEAAIPPLGLVDGARLALAEVDPDLPLTGIRTADSVIAESISMPRFRAILAAGFGLTALLLAAVGLYGVIACSVAQRTREFGVRMALGAAPGSVLGLVFREGIAIVAIGLVLGIGGGLMVSRLLESMLFRVAARDPVVFVVVPVLLTVVAAAALIVPARRAVRVDPIRALTTE